MDYWGIHDYQPCWCKTATELSDLLTKNSIVRLQVQAIWSLWNDEDKEWFEDAPIVICTQDQQIELCATNLNDFSVSLNSIDLNTPVYWCDDSDDPEGHPFLWFQQRNPEFSELPGKIITGVEVVEAYVEREMQIFVGTEEWILSGIGLQLNDEYLEILNGLDCNTLSRHRTIDRKLRSTQVH